MHVYACAGFLLRFDREARYPDRLRLTQIEARPNRCPIACATIDRS
jgi:hypothetical protein